MSLKNSDLLRSPILLVRFSLFLWLNAFRNSWWKMNTLKLLLRRVSFLEYLVASKLSVKPKTSLVLLYQGLPFYFCRRTTKARAQLLGIDLASKILTKILCINEMMTGHFLDKIRTGVVLFIPSVLSDFFKT